MRKAAQFSPAIVPALWALLLVLGIDGVGPRAAFLITFAVSIAYHVLEELRGRREA